jgi:hypothetical protein
LTVPGGLRAGKRFYVTSANTGGRNDTFGQYVARNSREIQAYAAFSYTPKTFGVFRRFG